LYNDLWVFHTDVTALCRACVDVYRDLDAAVDNVHEADSWPNGGLRAQQIREAAAAAFFCVPQLRATLDRLQDREELHWFDLSYHHSSLRRIVYDEAFDRVLQLGDYREDDTGRIDGRWMSIHGMAIGRAAKLLESGLLEHLASFKRIADFDGEFVNSITEQLIDDLRLAARETIVYCRNGHTFSSTNTGSTRHKSMDNDEVAAVQLKKQTIPREHRRGPVQKKAIARALKISYGTLQRRIEHGLIRCDEAGTRQSYYVDNRQFSQDEQGDLRYLVAGQV
jgi:hypothetical protein